MIERIEVLRGPAAARYGNGAAGGVVNIITKKAGDALHGSLNGYFNVPQHKQEGATKRTDFSLSGPLSDSLSFRLFGGYSKTQADARDINESHKSERVGAYANSLPAGREGWSIKTSTPCCTGTSPICSHWSSSMPMGVRATCIPAIPRTPTPMPRCRATTAKRPTASTVKPSA